MTYWLFALGDIQPPKWRAKNHSRRIEEVMSKQSKRRSESDWQFQAIPKIWVIGDHRPYGWKMLKDVESICLELSQHHLSWDTLQSTCAAMDTAIFTGSLDSSLQLVLFKQMVLWGFARIGAPPARSLELVSESSYLLCFIYLDLSFSPFLPWPQATYLSIQPGRPAHTSGYRSHRKITSFTWGVQRCMLWHLRSQIGVGGQKVDGKMWIPWIPTWLNLKIPGKKQHLYSRDKTLFHQKLRSLEHISWSNFPNWQTGQFRRLLLAARDQKRHRPTDSLPGEAMTKGDSKKKKTLIYRYPPVIKHSIELPCLITR